MQTIKHFRVLSLSHTPTICNFHQLFTTFVAALNILSSNTATLLKIDKICSFSRTISSNCKDMTDASESSYISGSSSVAFVTTPDEKLAKKLAQSLVEQKLAACVNIIPQIQSVYMWEGKVNEDNEYLMMIKTRTSRLDELIKFVRENHSYSVAEVITIPIEKGNVPYLSWIAQTVPDKK